MLIVFWIPELADQVRAISHRFGAGPARQIANAHTIFNVGLGFFFLPFTGILANFIWKIMPDREETKDVEFATWH